MGEGREGEKGGERGKRRGERGLCDILWFIVTIKKEIKAKIM